MNIGTIAGKIFAGYGMLGVLVALCIFFSAVTVVDQFPVADEAAAAVAAAVSAAQPAPGTVLVAGRKSAEGEAFANGITTRLTAAGYTVLSPALGEPGDVREALEKQATAGGHIDVLACDHQAFGWGVVVNAPEKFAQLGALRAYEAASYRWPNFLKRDNLRNITSQIAVIAILAIGMSLVIITGGIDLSVGSLIALSAVTCTLLIRDFGGGVNASPGAVILCCTAAVAACALLGLFSGLMVTFASVPSFIATLAVMLVAKGLAGVLSKSDSINQVPPNFDWLGMQTTLGMPNSVLLMIVLYAMAHVLMTYTWPGRYIYAVGGNVEAARLSGIPVRRVALLVFVICGALAGLGGVLMASQLKSGAMTYGVMYELYVIAAVVVGGTSLSGGRGRILGTLIGAFIIGVIRNGMNLLGLTEFIQMMVLGGVILAAVLLDTNKHHLMRLFKKRSA